MLLEMSENYSNKYQSVFVGLKFYLSLKKSRIFQKLF